MTIEKEYKKKIDTSFSFSRSLAFFPFAFLPLFLQIVNIDEYWFEPYITLNYINAICKAGFDAYKIEMKRKKYSYDH
jgi:hypothetical protein